MIIQGRRKQIRRRNGTNPAHVFQGEWRENLREKNFKRKEVWSKIKQAEVIMKIDMKMRRKKLKKGGYIKKIYYLRADWEIQKREIAWGICTLSFLSLSVSFVEPFLYVILHFCWAVMWHVVGWCWLFLRCFWWLLDFFFVRWLLWLHMTPQLYPLTIYLHLSPHFSFGRLYLNIRILSRQKNRHQSTITTCVTEVPCVIAIPTDDPCVRFFWSWVPRNLIYFCKIIIWVISTSFWIWGMK